MSEGIGNAEVVSGDLKASASKVEEVMPVNWDEVHKRDSNSQVHKESGADIDTHQEVGRPIVVYDDSDKEEDIQETQNGSENDLASIQADGYRDMQGSGEPGDDGMSMSEKEDHQSSLKYSSNGNDARREMEKESAEGNVCCDDHNIPVNTKGEAGVIEDSFKPTPTVEVKTDAINGVEVNGEVVCCERHDTPIYEVSENEEEFYDSSNVKAHVTFDEASYSGEIKTESGLEVEVVAPNTKNADKVDIDLGDPEVEKAATKIQAIFKGHQTRKDIKENTTAQLSDQDENQLVGLEEKGEAEKHEFMSVKLRRRTWEQEKNYNNVDVLKSIADEVDGDDGDQARVKRLISWAKSSKKTKTETMKVREKKKIDSLRQAVDPGSLSMVIEERGKGAEAPLVAGAAPSKGKKFEVRRVDSGSNFQVRKHSAILPQSETVVTKDWIQSAVKLHEQEADVKVTEMSFKKANDMYYASISAMVAGEERTYNWVIRVNPTEVDTNYNAKEKETFMVSELGKKIAEFVTRIKTQQGKMSVPFRPVIYADSQYAILDDLKAYKTFRDDTGFDLEHMKIALKGLAKLHAMTYAYFNRGSDNLQNFAQTLKLMVNRHYQPSSAKEDIDAKKIELALKFEYLLEVVRSTDAEGTRLADAAATKYGSGDYLYNIFKDAHSSSSNFSVLCHGALTSENVHFLYNEEQRPIDVKFTGFKKASYAHAVTDLQSFFAISMGPKVEEQAEFLLRFVYYETLVRTLKGLKVNPDITFIPTYDDLKTDFKAKELYGCLAGAMFLVGVSPDLRISGMDGGDSKNRAFNKRSSGKRVFESKIVGLMGKTDKRVYEASSPALRAKALIRKAMNERQTDKS